MIFSVQNAVAADANIFAFAPVFACICTCICIYIHMYLHVYFWYSLSRMQLQPMQMEACSLISAPSLTSSLASRGCTQPSSSSIYSHHDQKQLQKLLICRDLSWSHCPQKLHGQEPLSLLYLRSHIMIWPGGLHQYIDTSFLVKTLYIILNYGCWSMKYNVFLFTGPPPRKLKYGTPCLG